jgi:hypothetical protein
MTAAQQRRFIESKTRPLDREVEPMPAGEAECRDWLRQKQLA